jgi:hypothetical protein
MKKAFLVGPFIHALLTIAILLGTSSSLAFAQRFEAGTAFTVGTLAQNVFVGDFNRDGKPDLLIVDNPNGGSAATLEVLFGNGDGTFQSPVTTATIAGVSGAVAVGDFNGDGIPDVALGTANVNPGTINIFFGHSDGTFTASNQAPLIAGNSPQRMKAVAFNQTGILSLVVSNLDDDTVDFFAGKGDGTFTLAGTMNFSGSNSTLGNVFGFTFADLDGDGLADMAVLVVDFTIPSTPIQVKVLKGNGDGTFQSPVTTILTLAGAPSPGFLTAVDFDRDGKVDLILAGFEQVLMLPGNGDLTFQSPVVLADTAFLSNEIQAIDMNGDGHPDLVVPGGSIQVLLNDGHGKIASSRTYSSIASSLAIADFNGDGHPDFVAASTNRAGPNNLELILNNGDGTMDAAFSLSNFGIPIVADFNHDGQPDIGAVGSNSFVLINHSNFQFSFLPPPLVSETVGLSLQAVGGDLTGNGNEDVVMVDSTVPREPFRGGKMTVLLSNAQGILTLAPTQPAALPAPATLHKIAAGDFNGDGKLDVAVTNMDTNSTTVGIFLGNGDGTFQSPSLVTAGSKLTGIAVGDFSGHGHLDIAVSNAGDGTSPSTVSLLQGNGDGTFTLGTPVTVGVSPVALAAGDLKADGKLDLIVANSGNGKPGTVSILMGNGDGTFQPAVTLALPFPVVTLTLGDFNGDGFPDIAVAVHGNTIALFTNNGDGTFPQVPQQYAIGGDAGFLVAVDLNNGGLPDLVASASPLAVIPNRGGAQISLASSQNPSAPGQQVTFSASVVPNVPGVPAPTGTVQFSDGGSSLGTVPLSSAGTAAFSTSALTFGTHAIEARYSGDANFPARTFPGLFQVVHSPSSVQVASSANPSVFGGSVVISVSVTSIAGGTPTGSVSLLDGTTVIASATLDGSANGSFTLSTLTGGTHNLTASYAGDQTFLPSVSNPALPQVVNQAASSSSLNSNANPSTFGSSVSFTVNVTGVNSVAPTGTISLMDGVTNLASTTLDASGGATFQLANLGGGAHNLTASYAGDQNYAASVSAKLAEVINPAASASSLSSNFNPVSFSTNFVLTAAVSGPSAAVPTGTVSLLDGASTLTSAPLDASGKATFPLAGFQQVGFGMGAGTHSFTANYSGDQNFVASVSPVLQEVITKAASSLSLGVDPDPALLGNSVNIIVGVSPSAGGVPGVVSILDGSTVIGSANGAGNGFFTLKLSTLGPGPHSISANYSGDANRDPSISSTVSLAVFPADFSISSNVAAATLNAGQSVQEVITIFSNPSFTSPLTFSCSGLPALAACSFSPATISPNATFQSSTLTITTTGPSAMTWPSGPTRGRPFEVLATIFPGFAALMLLAGWKRQSLRRRILVAVSFTSLALFSSCGGGGGSTVPKVSQTPDGNSTVVVTATGPNGVAHQIAFILTVKN